MGFILLDTNVHPNVEYGAVLLGQTPRSDCSHSDGRKVAMTNFSSFLSLIFYAFSCSLKSN